MWEKFKKIGVTLIVLIIFLSSVPLNSFYLVAHAEDSSTDTPPSTGGETGSGQESGGSAANTTRTMLNFFQEERTSLQVDRVSRDELLVYGIFLSNFYIPWQTKIGDIKGEELSGRISTKFFGSSGRSSEVNAVNTKLHKAITDVMNFNKGDFGLYSSNPGGASSATVMSGEDLYKKIAEKDKNKQKVYGKNGEIFMDLSNPATRASLQVLFGIEPSYLVSKEKGLRALKSLYIDGFGNIWGAPSGVDVDEYVLVLPAVLNPRVYTKEASGFKFPVSNPFVMGAILKIKGDFLSGAGYQTPYYNVLDHVVDPYDKSNLVSIYGVYSPLTYVGKSDDIVKNKALSNPFDRVKAFLEADRETLLSKSQAKILLSVDAASVGGNVWKDVRSGVSEEQADNVVHFFTDTQAFKLDQIADKMYFFNVNNAGSENASDSETGSFNDLNSLIVKTELFTKGGEGGNFTFYSNSSIPSPFNNFYSQYLSKSASEKLSYLKSTTGNTVGTSSSKDKALTNFLDKGTWDVKDGGVIMDSMKVLMPKSFNFSMLPPSSAVSKVSTSTFWESILWGKHSVVTSEGLTKNDWYLTAMSSKAGFFSSFTIEDSKPFFPTNNSGGKLKNVDTAEDINAISTYFHNAMTYRVFSANNSYVKQLTGTAPNSGSYKTPWGNYKNNTSIMDGVNNYPGMYWGLMVALLEIGPDASGTKFKDPVPFKNPHLPYMEIDTLGGALNLNDVIGGSGVVSSDELTLDEIQKDIIKKIYGLLQPGYSKYRNELIKSYQDSWVISTHRAIIGNWADTLSVSAGGGGGYAASVGYINMPSLAELPMTSWLIKDYIYVYILLMLIVLVILVLFYLTNRRTLGEAILTGGVLAFVLILPQFLVNNVLQVTDKVGDAIFSEKFDYWAIIQHQQSIASLDSSKTTGDDLDYIIAQSMEGAKNVYSTDAGVRLKWMSPKKEDNFKKIFNENTASDTLMSNLTLFRWLFNSYFNQEEYNYNDPLATYIYRPYNAIASAARTNYTSSSNSEINAREVKDTIVLASSNHLGLPDYRFEKFKSSSKHKINYSKQEQDLLSKTGATVKGGPTEQTDAYRYWALANAEVTKSIFRTDYDSDAGMQVSNNSESSYQMFLAYTESPFYYFYNVMQQRYSKDNLEFGNALLDKNTFIVSGTSSDADGKIRDFLDLEGLFTYVIPYLQQSNEYVYGWTNIHGRSVEGFNFETGVPPEETAGEGATPEEIEYAKRVYDNYTSEKEKKENLEKVWMMYTPWVASIYDLSSAYNTSAKVAQKRVNIYDSLNPASYMTQGRDMIFSEADMRAKSYRYSDLTDVERRIQAVLDKTYEDFLYLVNYYDFDDEVLLTAAAMSATFNFNAEFSETRLLGESVTLYPQNYELKNFNYDAFMRLILLNSTGEGLMDKADLYERVVQKTSIFTGILLLVCDILGVIVVPAVKITTVMMLLFLTLLICISAVISPPEKLVKTIIKQLGVPTGLFMIACVAFSFVVGMFMGDGITAYVGSQTPSFNITDPTITMLLLIVVDLIFIFILILIMRLLYINLKSHFTKTVYGAAELVAQAGSSIMSKAKSAVRGKGSSNSYSDQYDEDREVQQRGGGVPSAGNVQNGVNGVGGATFSPAVMSDVTRKDHSTQHTINQANEVDKLANTSSSESVDSRTSTLPIEEPKTRSRRVGEKFIDFKLGVSSLGSKVSDAKDYVVSKEGLASDARDIAGKGKARVIDGTKNVVQGAKNKASNAYVASSEYVSNLRQYEIDKKQAQYESASSLKYSSQAKKTRRQDRLTDSIQALQNKQQISSNRRTLVRERFTKTQS